MKKKLCMLLIGLCFILLSACGSRETSVNSDNAHSMDKTQTPASNDASQKDTIDSENTENKDTENNVNDLPDASDTPDTDEGLVDGMHPEFKEAMDSYEAFYNEYCDFMKKYAENPSDMNLISGYTDMLTRSTEMSEKFDAWKDSEMNDTELKYYLEVQERVLKKLLDVSE